MSGTGGFEGLLGMAVYVLTWEGHGKGFLGENAGSAGNTVHAAQGRGGANWGQSASLTIDYH